MRTFLGLVAAVVIISLPAAAQAVGSCGTGGELGARQMIAFEGSVYYVTTPASYDPSKAWPLIFGLHGDEGDPARSVNLNWRTVTDDRFIFVAPKAPNTGGSWYAATDANSVWMDALLASLLSRYNIDLDRVSIWGLSGGAVFISTYALTRQGVFAAVEFNMGGSARRYVAPPRPECKIPARFVVSTTDFLRPGAMTLFNTLTTNQHQTAWVDANCVDHCFDRIEAGPNARDWLLTHTLCGAMPTAGCRTGGTTPDGGSSPADAGTTPRDAGAGDARPVDAGAGDARGGPTGTGGSVGSSTGGGSGTSGTGGATGGSGPTTGTGGGPGTGGGTGTGTGGAGAPPASDTGGASGPDGGELPPGEVTGSGCGCDLAKGRPTSSSVPALGALLVLLVLLILAARRRPAATRGLSGRR